MNWEGMDGYQRALTAHHEAGHAVAAVMRDSGELVSITIEPTDKYLGHTGFRSTRLDTAFIVYAGVWAEARAQWTEPTLDEDDENGCIFDDYVAAAFISNRDGDLEEYDRALKADPVLRPEVQDSIRDAIERSGMKYERPEEGWSRELEQVWLTIRKLAELLLAEEHVDHDVVDGLLTQHWERIARA